MIENIVDGMNPSEFVEVVKKTAEVGGIKYGFPNFEISDNSPDFSRAGEYEVSAYFRDYVNYNYDAKGGWDEVVIKCKKSRSCNYSVFHIFKNDSPTSGCTAEIKGMFDKDFKIEKWEVLSGKLNNNPLSVENTIGKVVANLNEKVPGLLQKILNVKLKR